MGANKSDLKQEAKVDLTGYPKYSWLAKDLKKIYLKTSSNELWSSTYHNELWSSPGQGWQCLFRRKPKYINFEIDQKVSNCCNLRLKYYIKSVGNGLYPAEVHLHYYLAVDVFKYDDRHVITLNEEDDAIMREAQKIALNN